MILQRQIYWTDLDPVRGREQQGRRPCLVLTRDPLNALPLTVLVMAGTSAERVSRRYPTDILVTAQESGLPKDTVFLGLQIRSVDPGRLVALAGRLPDCRLPEVLAVLRYLVEG